MFVFGRRYHARACIYAYHAEKLVCSRKSFTSIPSSSLFHILTLVWIYRCCILLTNDLVSIFCRFSSMCTLHLKGISFGLPSQPSHVILMYNKGIAPNVELVVLSNGYDSRSKSCLVVKLFCCLVRALGLIQFTWEFG